MIGTCLPTSVTLELIIKCHLKHIIIFYPEGEMFLISFLLIFQLKFKVKKYKSANRFLLCCQATDLYAATNNYTCEK